MQQFLFHLSQVTPRRNNLHLKKPNQQSNGSRSTAAPVACSTSAATAVTSTTTTASSRQQSHIFSGAELHELCILSFNETLVKLKNSPLASALTSVPFEAIFTKDHPIIVKKYRQFVHDHKTSPWKIDYTSKQSFRENHADALTAKSSLLMFLQSVYTPNRIRYER